MQGQIKTNSPIKITTLAFGIVLFTCAAWAGADTDPANPGANAATRAVLKYFQSLSATPERRIVSGQFSNFGKGAKARALMPSTLPNSFGSSFSIRPT